MDVTLPVDSTEPVEHEATGGLPLDERERGERRLEALRRVGEAVDRAGLYERILIPGSK